MDGVGGVLAVNKGSVAVTKQTGRFNTGFFVPVLLAVVFL